jgi:hypothetical protein
MPILNIRRTNEYVNRLRDYGIYIDGQKLGTIANGETKSFEVTQGLHTVYCKIDWCRSPEIHFEATENGAKVYTVGGFRTARWLMPLALGIIVLDYILRITVHFSLLFFLLVPVFLLLVYFITLGRKNYLTLSEAS